MNVYLSDWPAGMQGMAFKRKPRCKVNDLVYFKHQGVTLAKAKVGLIVPPGSVVEARNGKSVSKFWMVYWKPGSFVDLRGKQGDVTVEDEDTA